MKHRVRFVGFESVSQLAHALIVVVICSPALALPVANLGVKNCNNSLHNADFYDPATGLKALAQPLELTTAATRLQIYQGDKTFGCSGAFISDEGDVLSASHCFDSCRFEADQSSNPNPPPCRGSINGQPVEFEFITAPECSYDQALNAFEAKGDAAASAKISEACRNRKFNDAIVIRAKKLPGNFPAFRCLALSQTALPLGSSVFTMGYPSATQRSFHRPAAKDSNGRDLFVSSGETLKSDKCEASLYNNSPVTRWWTGQDEHKEKQSLNPKVLEMMKDMYQTTVDVVPGNSGGPLITTDDEIAGVTSTTNTMLLQSELWECRGATFFQPTTDLAQTLKNKGLEKAMDCQTKKISKTTNL